MAEFDVAKAVVNYRNRFLKSVIHDLLVRYGKRDILYIIAECISEIEPDKPLLITTEDDGSRWVQLEDYMYLQGSLYKNESYPENTSGLTQRAPDAGDSATSQAVSNAETFSTSDGVPSSAPARVA